MDTPTVVALVLAGLAAIATVVPWLAHRLNLRRDAIRWLRAQRAQLHVDMLMQARAQQFYLSFITSSDPAWEGMREVFAEEDTRLPSLERAWLGASGSVFASPQVRGLYEQLFAEAWPGEGESRAVPLG